MRFSRLLSKYSPRATAVLSLALAAGAWSDIAAAMPMRIGVKHVSAFPKRDCDTSNGCTRDDDDGCSIIIYDDGSVECHD